MSGFHKSGHIWYSYCVCMYGTQVSVMAVWMKKFKREAIQVLDVLSSVLQYYWTGKIILLVLMTSITV